MYLTPLKALFVQALKRTFDEAYPVESLRGMHVSIEYPIDKANYPGIWVDFDDTDSLKRAGVDHVEMADTSAGPVQVTRWEFSGYVSLTVTALTSLERDLLYDELVGMIAFSRQDTRRGRFRQMIEANDYLAVNMDSDTISPRGAVAAPGTPWGTDDIVYERTINIAVIGEFVPKPDEEGALLLLSEIIVKAFNMADPEQAEEILQSQGGFTADQWH